MGQVLTLSPPFLSLALGLLEWTVSFPLLNNLCSSHVSEVTLIAETLQKVKAHWAVL